MSTSPATLGRPHASPPPLPSPPTCRTVPPPRPSSSPLDGIPVVALPADVRALSIAERAREAMLAILHGIDAGWSKRELARWLAGPYETLTSYAAALELPEESSTFRRPPRGLANDRLEAVLRAAKEEVLATLIMAAPPDSDVRFTHRAVTAGHVVRARDAHGRGGWTPVDAPGMLLSDRILALVSVDYLMRPADYLALLSVCGLCQAVSFDAQVRVRGHCPEHRRSLGKIGIASR